MNKQIELNIDIENLLQEFLYSKYKREKSICVYNTKVKQYEAKISKCNNDMFQQTCHCMIENYNKKRIELEENISFELEALKERLWTMLYSAIVNTIISSDTINVSDDYIVYMVPSAKITMLNRTIKLVNDDLVKKSTGKSFDEIETSLEVNEDGTISYGNTMVLGVTLTEPQMKIKFLEV